MITPKSSFPLVLYQKKHTLFAVGGKNKNRLKTVEEFSVLRNKWKKHSLLPQANFSSSAIVLNEILYNFDAE